jgi:CBS domain-containing protein
MIVADFMTRQVVTVAPDAAILQAAKLMLEHKISGLPVVDAAGHVVGIVSEHDLLRQRRNGDGTEGPHWLQLMIEKSALPGEADKFRDRKVEEVMTRRVVSIAETSSLGEASRIIGDLNVKRLPVVRNDKLVGIIARADLIRALTQNTESFATAKAAPDVSVSQRLSELERQVWRSRARVCKPF